MTVLRRCVRAALVITVASGLVVGCGGDDNDASTTTSAGAPNASDPATTSGSGSADPPGPADSVTDLSRAAISLTLVAELDAPIGLTTRADSVDLYVAERAGRVRMLHLADDGTAEVGGVVIDVSADTSTELERGLLGLTFNPAGDRLYLSFTDLDGHTRVDEWTMAGDSVDPDSRRIVYQLNQPFPNHNGGWINFGPDDMLYLGLGDGGGGGDPLGAGQDFDTALGALIRIDPTPSDGLGYTIPPDNPFVDGGGAPEIWATGLRNPWRFSWDDLTGDLWIADVGQNAIEEITMLAADAAGEAAGRGANLGWAIFEGNEPFHGGPEPDGYAPPLHTYQHRPGCSITGGYVSRGDSLPGLSGVYLYSDFCDPQIYAVLQRDGAVVETKALDISVPGGQVVSFGQGSNGDLFVMSLAGGLYRIDPA